ncbi:MAG: redoxin domain-containing protein [Myxococcaceae bacterium]|nr:redoxin domain-containing protein [Myxococcaceae bacterium]
MESSTRSPGLAAPLPQGLAAPQFTLPVSPRLTTSLGDWLGAPVVLVFYAADFSPVCSDELLELNALMPMFTRRGARVFAISVDSVWSHLAYARQRPLTFPLLSDFHPKGAVAKAYNAWCESDGTAERALYVIDAEGRIAWSHRSPINVNPGIDGVLDALDRLGRYDPHLEAT